MALEKGGELTISYLQDPAKTAATKANFWTRNCGYLQDEDLLKSTSVRQQKLQNWSLTEMQSLHVFLVHFSIAEEVHLHVLGTQGSKKGASALRVACKCKPPRSPMLPQSGCAPSL